MTTIRVWTLSIAMVTAALVGAAALDIPLGGGGGDGGSARIGFVDMDRIFEIYPQTQTAREDYLKQLKRKKEQLAEKEGQLNEIKSRLSVLKSTVKDMPAPSPDVAPEDVPAAPAGTGNLEGMRAELEAKRVEYEELKKQASQDLATFESQQSQLILGKIYQALRDLAVDEQVSVVVDKSAILYGDTAIDLTEKLQQRVRGF